MAFYSIIFGILFLGAFRQVLLLYNTPDLWIIATIAILIFSDTVNTSNVLESSVKRPYTFFMKLIDLTNFILLNLVLISYSPGDNYLCDIPIPDQLTNVNLYSWYFILLYWVLAIIWNWQAGILKANNYYTKWYIWVILSLIPFYLIIAILSSPYPNSELSWYQSPAYWGFISTFAILFILKIWGINENKKNALKKK